MTLQAYKGVQWSQYGQDTVWSWGSQHKEATHLMKVVSLPCTRPNMHYQQNECMACTSAMHLWLSKAAKSGCPIGDQLKQGMYSCTRAVALQAQAPLNARSHLYSYLKQSNQD